MAKCRIAAGKIYAKDLSVANQPYLPIGNAQLAIAIEEEEQTLPDYTNVAGGNACSVRDISGVGLTLTMYDFDKKNLALAVYGAYGAPAGASIVDEPVQLFEEGIAPVAHMPTNTGTLEVGATTYVAGTDYNVTAGGIQVIAGSALATAIAASPDGDPPYLDALFSYTHGIEDVVDALVTSGKTFALLVDAKNKAAGGAAEVWRFHKVQFGPTGGLNVITREFGSFEVGGEVLADDTQPDGESQYFTIQQAQVA
jgi:hypothetical protein